MLGFDSQGSVNFFPNLHLIHVKALEVEDWGPGLLPPRKAETY